MGMFQREEITSYYVSKCECNSKPVINKCTCGIIIGEFQKKKKKSFLIFLGPAR